MAETDLYNSINKPQIPPNPTKFYTHFLYKAIFVSIFILILPLFPSQAPDFINQTINSRSWELLQLLFVGIAVSYGLFSKRNEETEKDHDGAPAYVAGLLQVSSVFDDESENLSGSDDHNKIQTWNSQYYRGEPIVVVAKESSVLDDHAGAGGSKTVEKPLLLPVRSLKNAVSESPMIDSSLNKDLRSNSMRFSSKSEEKTEENVVLRSPIPWRSRSGRMEVKADAEISPPLFSQAPSMADSFRSQSSKSLNPISNSSSQNKIYPSSPSLLSEIQSKSIEDVVRKKNSQRSSFSSIPPPPPPPPPPHFLQRYPTFNSNYSHNNTNDSSGNEFRRRTRSFPKEISRKTEDLQNRGKIDFDDKDLRDDKEIESFIQRRNQQMKNFTPSMAKQAFTEYPDEEQEEFVQKVAMEAGKVAEESDEEDEEDEKNDKFEELASNGGTDNGGPDVDKKADEFIAKFREQIRLQRIASIRRSTGQISKNTLR